jgi:hypothetical protein
VNQRARLVIGYALAVAAFGGMLNATTVVLRAKGGEWCGERARGVRNRPRRLGA